MKKFHKIVVVLLVSFIILLGGYVNAATDSSEKLGEIKITSSLNKVQKGESFYITISAECFGEDENGTANTLDGYSGKVNYNSEDLELVSTELIDTEHWANMSGNSTELAAMWLTEQEDGVTLEEAKADIYIITFKVKDDTDSENTVITLSDNTLSAGKYIVETDDISLDIELTNIVTEENPDDDNSNDEDTETPGTGEQPDNSDNENKDEENKDEENKDDGNEDKKDEQQSEKENQINNIIIGNDDGDTTNTLNKYNGQSSSTADSSTSSKTLPYAGKFFVPIIITLLLGVVTYGTIGYLKYNKYKKI